MNNLVLASHPRPAPASRPTSVALALLGTGMVGTAVLQRLACWEGTSMGSHLKLLHVANSRGVLQPRGTRWEPSVFRGHTTTEESLGRLPTVLGDGAVRVVIDATASEDVAECHADWLAQGLHVVTASKLGQGASLARWHDITSACATGGMQYGDSATVGAGLPMLRSIRALRAGGDRILGVAGILSGSMAWLCNRYDGLRPFSGFVRAAREAGYTEPDPRQDLSGEDVRRKLLILARAAGIEFEASAVDVRSLVPAHLRTVPLTMADASLTDLDASMREAHANACKGGRKLHFIARLQCDPDSGKTIAKVGLESLSPDDPLAGGTGTDNRLAIWSDRYRDQPLLIQGPGAGAAVTAAALLDDVLRIAANHPRIDRPAHRL